MHEGIRIRERYLTALEEERWDMLPGEAYTKGFLRTYAEFLGLNGNLYIDEYNARIAHRDEEPIVPESLEPKRVRSSVLRTLVGILVLGAAVASLAAWRLGGTSNPPTHETQHPVTPVSAPAHVVSKPKPKRVAQPTATFATLTATRGRSWLQVRANGPNGALLFQGFIAQGATKKFMLDHTVWVRLGRPDLLDLTVGGRNVTPHSANPANVLITRSGAKTLS